VALVLAPPLALGAGMLWLLLEPARLWRHAALVGAVAALLLAVAVGVLAWRAWRGGRNFVAHAVTGVALLALAALVETQTAGQAGMAQALGYERDSAYALALTAYADAGATNTVLARVHTEWADTAYNNSADYPVATAQYRAAIALEGNDKSASDNRAALLKLTTEWGRHLGYAHEFKQAAAVYAAHLASPSCDKACHASVQEQGGAVYLAWAADLIAQKQPDAALAQLRTLMRAFPQSKAAASAQQVLADESQGLAGAWSAQKAGDGAAMNLLLALVAVRATDPLQVALASEAPEMVSGTLASARLYKTPIHLYFLGFRTSSDAKTYMALLYLQDTRDLRVNTISTQADKNGAFTAWLPAGYVYVPVWEAPPVGQVDGYFSWSYSFVTVQPYSLAPLTAYLS
jgi:hypothetical protein